jgi:hypothetical protein
VRYKALLDPNTGEPIQVFTNGGEKKPAPPGMPSTVVVYGMHYTVSYHSCIYNTKKKKSQRLRGVVIYPNRLIVLDPSQSIHDLRETLYHEVGHIYLKTWQTKSQRLANLSEPQIEDTCDLFGEAIYDLLSNNLLQTPR